MTTFTLLFRNKRACQPMPDTSQARGGWMGGCFEIGSRGSAPPGAVEGQHHQRVRHQVNGGMSEKYQRLAHWIQNLRYDGTTTVELLWPFHLRLPPTRRTTAQRRDVGGAPTSRLSNPRSQWNDGGVE